MNEINNKPLAEILRPIDFGDIIGQKHLFGNSGIISAVMEVGKVPSIILYGPAGCGKTTIAKNLANIGSYYVEILLATNSNSSMFRKIFENAKNRKEFEKRDTILIIDEIHYLNKSQQDLFLPFIEAITSFSPPASLFEIDINSTVQFFL